MKPLPKPAFRILGIFGVVASLSAAAYLSGIADRWSKAFRKARAASVAPVRPEHPRVRLVDNQPDTLRVPNDVRTAMGITLTDISPASAAEPLFLDGTLFLDTNSMVHVHSRFAGDVVEVGVHLPAAAAGDDAYASVELPRRPIQFGDHVSKGDLLAVVWSKDLGEKKSELVEDLSRLKLSEVKLEKLEELLVKGATSDRNVREAGREVEAALISVERTERTLRSWRLTEAEIATIRDEAESVRQRRTLPRTSAPDPEWARVEVRAPISGTIVEKNVAVGDYIPNDLDIFKIADLGRMDVLAHCYEDDLPSLEKLPLAERHWTISLKADPQARPLEGRFDRIGNIIDPNQHTALVMGWVDNSVGRLRVGQFVTARIDLPTPPGEVAVPVAALVDQDGLSFVFVQSSGSPSQFTRYQVWPVRRHGDFVMLNPAGQCAADGEKCVRRHLQTGERVVATGAIQLAAELIRLQAAAHVQAANR